MNAYSSFSIRTLWPVLALIATLAWASSYDKGGHSGPDIPYFDKIAHFFVFGLMGTLWYRCLPSRSIPLARWLVALTLVLSYGVLDEWIQSHNPNRVSDIFDWVADGAGAITAIFVYRGWRLYRRVLETRFSDLFRLKLADID